jgi:hypothetical protein
MIAQLSIPIQHAWKRVGSVKKRRTMLTEKKGQRRS